MSTTDSSSSDSTVIETFEARQPGDSYRRIRTAVRQNGGDSYEVLELVKGWTEEGTNGDMIEPSNNQNVYTFGSPRVETLKAMIEGIEQLVEAAEAIDAEDDEPDAGVHGRVSLVDAEKAGHKYREIELVRGESDNGGYWFFNFRAGNLREREVHGETGENDVRYDTVLVRDDYMDVSFGGPRTADKLLDGLKEIRAAQSDD